ncbi:hypothetical protein JTB14_006988 [Gonioctena quinquepunctata]|nr:hypothetical protein JTB14_006988 [Gonioctena quinquepunctata]
MLASKNSKYRLHPGKDGITRVVSVKVRGQVLKREVTKICVLPEE